MFNDKILSEQDKLYLTKMKKVIAFLIMVFLAIIIIFFAIKSVNELNNGDANKNVYQINNISVNGTGEVFAKPDIAQVTIAVSKSEKTAFEAQQKNAEAINQVIKFIKETGIEEKDIKTTNYSLNPVYDYITNRGSVLKGYEARQNLEIKIRNITNVGKVLEGATEAGANEVYGLVFTIDDEEKLKEEARKIAIQKAKDKAKELSKDLDVKLKKLISFSESGGMPPPIYPVFETFGKTASAPVSPEVPTGENKISITVTLTYEIK